MSKTRTTNAQQAAALASLAPQHGPLGLKSPKRLHQCLNGFFINAEKTDMKLMEVISVSTKVPFRRLVEPVFHIYMVPVIQWKQAKGALTCG
jgi:hypothetical protein